MSRHRRKLGRPAALDRRMERFFVGMKRLTEAPTPAVANSLRRWMDLQLPSPSTLNSMCRRYGVKMPRAEERFFQVRPLGELRVHVFRGWLIDDETKAADISKEDICVEPYEVALAYDPWSGALVARVRQSFRATEALQAFLRTVLHAFPPEYRYLLRRAVMLHRSESTWRLNPRAPEPVELSPLFSPASHPHDPIRVGLLRLLDAGAMEKSGFVHFLSRLTADYNSYEAGTQLKSLPGRLVGFNGWTADGDRVSNAAAVFQKVAKCRPAVRLFMALSNLRNPEHPRRRKYALTKIAKQLAQDQQRKRPPKASKGVSTPRGGNGGKRSHRFPIRRITRWR